jgi:hypothetical protein
MPNTMTLISSFTATSSVASISFSSIPSTYTDLKLVLSTRGSAASVQTVTVILLNSLTSGYVDKFLYGSGSVVGTGSYGASSGFVGDAPAANATASTFGSAEVYIFNYASGNMKTMSVDSVAETNATQAFMELTSLYNTTSSAVNSISVLPASGNYVQHTTAYLYGIKNS